MQEIMRDKHPLLPAHHCSRLEFGGVAKERHIGHRWEVRPKPRPETLTLYWQAFHFSQHSQL